MTMDIREDYSEKYITQYDEESFEKTLVGIRREEVLASWKRHGARRVLEVGCGLEPLFLFTNEFERLVIVEPSAAFVAHGRSLNPDDRVQLIEGYLEQTDLGDEKFDFIVLSSLLHEVPDPRALLDSVHKLCSDQTVVHINVPNVWSFHRLLAKEMGLIDDIFERSSTEARFHRQTRFDRGSLEAIVKEAGFAILEFGTYLIKPFTHEQMQKLVGDPLFGPPIVEGLRRMVRYLPDMGCEMYVDVRRA